MVSVTSVTVAPGRDWRSAVDPVGWALYANVCGTDAGKRECVRGWSDRIETGWYGGRHQLPASESGFGYDPIFEGLEGLGAEYAIVARLTPGFRSLLPGLRYEAVNREWEMADGEHRSHGWSKTRRFVVARRFLAQRETQPTLFSVGRYAYRAWVTNLSLTPAGIWHFYDGRAALERRIRELREDFALRKVPTRAFTANALFLEIIRLAYNLVTAFQATCVPQEWQALTLSKLRHRLFWLPGELSRPDNRPTLWLGNSASIRMWTEKILHRAHKLTPLEN